MVSGLRSERVNTKISVRDIFFPDFQQISTFNQNMFACEYGITRKTHVEGNLVLDYEPER